MPKHKKRPLTFTLAAMLAATAVSAAAAPAPEKGQGQQPPPNMAEAFIKQQDTDGDGKVSQAEALGPQEARFRELDADRDGSVTAEEFRASFEAQVPPETRQRMKERGLGEPSETFLKELDKNGNGKVDLSEAVQPSVEGFKRMDTDGDGFATQDEADAFLHRMREEMSRMHPRAEPPAD